MRNFTLLTTILISCFCGVASLFAQTQQIGTTSSDIKTSVESLAADFTSDLIYTCSGGVSFQDLSTNTPTNWFWQFGDGGFSTEKNPTYTYSNSGLYTVSLEVTNTQGIDTIIKTAYVTIEKPEVTTTTGAETCPNGTATLSATNGTGVLNWYDGSSALVHTGATFTTPSLSSSTTYFVEEVLTSSETQFAPPMDAASVGGGGYHGSGFTGGVNFTAFQASEIVSVWVDANGTTARTIYLYDGFVIDGQDPITNPIIDQVTVIVPDGQGRIQLNLQVPAAGDYCLGGNNMDMFRNNNGAASYPYTLPGILEKVSATTTSNGFYYYFYDWEMEISSECVSPQEAVTATIVDASFTSIINGGQVTFADNSIGATNWMWDFGDGTTSTVQSPVHIYTTTNGPHNVTLTINNGVCSFMDSVTVSVGIEQIADNMTLAIYPNPTSHETTLSFSQDLPEDLNIELIGMNGKILMQSIMQAGESSKTLNVSQLPPAMYMIRMFTSDIIDVRKIVVGR